MFACQRCLRRAVHAVARAHPRHGAARLVTTDQAALPPLAPEDQAEVFASARPRVAPRRQDLRPPRVPSGESTFGRRFPTEARQGRHGASGERSRAGVRETRTRQSGSRSNEETANRRLRHVNRLQAQDAQSLFTPSSTRHGGTDNNTRDIRSSKSSLNKSTKPGNLRRELVFLQDPLELAKHVERTLRQGDEEKALALVRMSSRDIANIVSWNHVIKFQLAADKHTKALETFNDLKKRGLQPDSHTYLILLDGLSKNARNPKALGRALSIYHSLNGPKSKAPPSIMHTNAVLKVCSRARDLDSIWDIFSKLPERGSHAADAITYTTVLNALLYNATMSTQTPGQQSGPDQASVVEEAITQAKGIWRDVVTRWRDDSLPMEEALVCAMGRLLLNGSRPRDWDSVLSLLQQTMGIARLTPRLADANLSASGMVENDPFAVSVLDKKVSSPRKRQPRPATPTNNTLSLIVATCAKAHQKDTAMDYWNLLTDQNAYAILPDTESFNVLLRLQRLFRSSASALSIVTEDMARADAAPRQKTYRLAINVCERAQQIRGGAREKAWRDATELVQHMIKTLSEPDVATLTTYLAMTRECVNVGSTAFSSRDSNGSQSPDNALKVYVEALKLVDRAMPAMRNSLAATAGGRTASPDLRDHQAACRRLLEAVVAAYEHALDLSSNGAGESTTTTTTLLRDLRRGLSQAKQLQSGSAARAVSAGGD